MPAPNDQPPVRLHEVSASLLAVLGVRPILGRDMTADDSRSRANVALLSYETWQRRFGGTVDVLTHRFVSGRREVSVIGVLPKGFVPPSEVALDPEWDGLVLDVDDWAALGRTGMVMAPIARLRPGASLQASRAEMSALVAALEPELNRASSGRVPRIQIDPLESALYERLLKYGWLIVGASVLILLMACANLSVLLLVRGRAHQRSVALRMALGASVFRIVATSLFETLTIAGLGTAAAQRDERLNTDARAPAVYGLVAVVLLLTAALAAWLPARRCPNRPGGGVEISIILNSES